MQHSEHTSQYFFVRVRAENDSYKLKVWKAHQDRQYSASQLLSEEPNLTAIWPCPLPVVIFPSNGWAPQESHQTHPGV
jgi:hypothetical protein